MIFQRLAKMDKCNFYYSREVEHLIEIIKSRLYFGVTSSLNPVLIKNTSNVHYFCTDDELFYINYYYDFGPLNISCLYKYCMKLNSFLKFTQTGKKIIHYTSNDPNKRTNAAFLMGFYAVLYLNMNPKEIYNILLYARGKYRNFVDASQGVAQYTIHLLDCFCAIHKAAVLNFFNFDDFNCDEYDKNDKLENGDMNWLVPRKFLAFIGPSQLDFNCSHKPEFYLNYFLRNDIRTVIRLNNKLYDESAFLQAGIEHHELFFPDGSTPPKSILVHFLNICESAPGAIAVHCKAGLGRTGSLIGAYIVKHYRLTAREAIAWMRICRPGSVIGQQQAWLEKIESWLWRQGSQYRVQHYGEGDKIPRHKYGIYSLQWPRERSRAIQASKEKREQSAKNEQEKKKKQTTAQTNSSRYYQFPKKRFLNNQSEQLKNILSRVIPQPVMNEETFCKQPNNSFIRDGKPRALLSLKQDKPKTVSLKRFDDTKIKTNNLACGRREQKYAETNNAKQTQGDHLNQVKVLKKMTGGIKGIQGKQYLPLIQKKNVGIGY